MNFGQISEILGPDFCADMKLYTQPATIANCPKIIDNYAKNGEPEVV